MSARRGSLCLLWLATAVVSSGCSEHSSFTAPERVARPEAALLGGLLGGVTSLLIPPVERTTPLAQDITWSFTVGPAGASSSNSVSGLTISVPSNAVSTSTTITVTALAGAPVAYRFEPHGLVFARKVTLTQNLRGTTADGLLSSLVPLSGAYFATDDLELDADGLANVTEIIPATLSLLTRKASFPIEHFSGYILASGRGSARESEDGQ